MSRVLMPLLRLGCKSFIQFLLDALSGGVLVRLHLVFQLLYGLLCLVFAVFGLPARDTQRQILKTHKHLPSSNTV